MAEDKGHHEGPPPLWGVSAEFETADGMVAALEALQQRNLGRLDAFSPTPIPQASLALRLPRQTIHPFAIAAAVAGGLGMFAYCAYITIWGYRFNIGGRPLFSWPAFVVPSFSFAMMCGSLAVLVMLLVLNRLPRLNHPAFNIPDFGRVSNDRFFVAIEARDDTFSAELVERVLGELALRPHRVVRVSR